MTRLWPEQRLPRGSTIVQFLLAHAQYLPCCGVVSPSFAIQAPTGLAICVDLSHTAFTVYRQQRENESVQYVLILLLALHAAIAQTRSASIAGSVLDAKTLKPVPAAIVMAIRSGLPPLSRNTRSGGDGAFQIDGLESGSYSLCVQVDGERYLDPCLWDATPPTVALAAGQAATGTSLRITLASVVDIEVRDAQKVMSQKTKDGRQPALSVGVWGPDLPPVM